MIPTACVALPTLTELAHRAVERAMDAVASLTPQGAMRNPLLAVDATAGNGYDTLFLAQSVGETGLVAAFDIQPVALAATRSRLAAAGLERRVRLVLAGHERLETCLPCLFADAFPTVADETTGSERVPALTGQVAAVLFNLGFLPGSDKETTTHPETTLPALDAAARLLAPHGLLAVHIYTGHPGGREEGQAVLAWGEALPWPQWRCLTLSQHNKPKNREWLLLAERL